ncbi:MAG: hypothetical protein FJ317_08295 [SAR202 cluster bacterium]|nr:hypothetical protein [SAR202 cluster bacterium]
MTTRKAAARGGKSAGKGKMAGKIQTVLGPIEPDQLGITLTHEHLVIDMKCYREIPDDASSRWYWDKPLTIDILGNMARQAFRNKDTLELLDVNFAIQEVLKYRYAGGNSLVDATSIGIGRDPLALTRISRATGLNIIMGASYYTPVSYPADIGSRTEQQITDQIIRDVTVGVGDTGVKSGVIGEIGNFWPTNENTRKILRASAHAAMETGAPILIHPGFHPDSPAHILNDLMEAGMDPKRVIIGHLDIIDSMDAIRDIAEMGVMLEHDRFGWEDSQWGDIAGQTIVIPSDVQRMERYEQLIEWGFLDRLLVAQDVCMKTDTTAYGGKGYAHIVENIVPRMRKRGFTEKQIQTILVDNPKKILTFV